MCKLTRTEINTICSIISPKGNPTFKGDLARVISIAAIVNPDIACFIHDWYRKGVYKNQPTFASILDSSERTYWDDGIVRLVSWISLNEEFIMSAKSRQIVKSMKGLRSKLSSLSLDMC